MIHHPSSLILNLPSTIPSDMMFAPRMLLSSSGRKVAVAGKLARTSVGQRFMSVINISDMDATEKFTRVNKKSVLYFTASW